jgi:D-arabinose 1-dehydrogenase-like Zn-dependent alcohol dehydrogenase
MTEKGRAAVFTKIGDPMVIKEYPVMDPQPGQVLVKNSLANICGSDLHIWRGETPLGRGAGMDVILGHELTGRVHKLGKGVDTDALGRPLKEGDRIVFSYYSSCGACLACFRGDDNQCMTSLMTVMRPSAAEPHFFGGFGDYYYVNPKQKILKVPDALPDEMVAGVNCALSQVIFGLLEAELRFGETVVIQGAGGLGQYATAVAKEMGASKVIVIDGVAGRLEMAKKMGADEVIDISQMEDARARTGRVFELTEGWGADLVVEVVGRPEAMPEGIRMMGRGARYLTLGNITAKQYYKEDPSILVGGNRSIIGISLYPPIILKRGLDFLARCKDKYPLADVPVKYPLEKINEAFEDADQFAKGGKGVTRASIDLAA